MTGDRSFDFRQLADVASACVIALVAAAALLAFGTPAPLPVLGAFPLTAAVLTGVALALAAAAVLSHRGLRPTSQRQSAAADGLRLLALGAVLAVPPILVDLALPFPRDMNVPLPEALAFYPAIALVAEAAFHLVPLALLSLVPARILPRTWLILPVIFVEPVFQATFSGGPTVQGVLVLCTVSLLSTAQLLLYRRYGFVAMFGLRIAFYLFWHILWGWARLSLVF